MLIFNNNSIITKISEIAKIKKYEKKKFLYCLIGGNNHIKVEKKIMGI